MTSSLRFGDLGSRNVDLCLAVLLVTAMTLGGGGSPAPLPELLVEWAALLAAAAALSAGHAAVPGRAALLLAGSILLLPLVQLVPLPPSVWQALPGRTVELAALSLIDRQSAWMPWSLSPSRTLASALALIPPVVVLVLTAIASTRGRTIALGVLVAIALLSVLLGAAQLAGGDQSPLRFYPSQAGSLVGFQANRNATADVLIVGLLAAAALLMGDPANATAKRYVIAASAAGALALGIVRTGSRTGLVLLLIVLVGAGVGLAWRRTPAARGRWLPLAGVLVAGLFGLWSLAQTAVVRGVLDRFRFDHDPRQDLWIDTLYAAAQHWPWGSGLGTFVPVFIAAERLEAVNKSMPNRAHNDFLEFALEAGLPGLLLLVALSALLVWRAVVALRQTKSPEARSHVVFAAATLGCLGLHSIVDYPVRTLSLACVAAFAAGIILNPRERQDHVPSKSRSSAKHGRAWSAGQVATIVIGVGVGWLAYGSALDRLSAGTPGLAPHVPTVLRGSAWRSEAAALVDQAPRRAIVAAQRGVAADPIDPGASSALGLARLAAGDRAGAAAAMLVAGSLGWRDQPAQAFLLAMALAAGDVRVAAQRLDGLLRIEDRARSAELLRLLEGTPEGRRALAERLAERPAWLASYPVPTDDLVADDLVHRAQVLAAPALRGVVACSDVSGLILALQRNGQSAAADQLRFRRCSAPPGSPDPTRPANQSG
jgi:O-antigen ligase